MDKLFNNLSVSSSVNFLRIYSRPEIWMWFSANPRFSPIKPSLYVYHVFFLNYITSPLVLGSSSFGGATSCFFSHGLTPRGIHFGFSLSSFPPSHSCIYEAGMSVAKLRKVLRPTVVVSWDHSFESQEITCVCIRI